MRENLGFMACVSLNAFNIYVWLMEKVQSQWPHGLHLPFYVDSLPS